MVKEVREEAVRAAAGLFGGGSESAEAIRQAEALKAQGHNVRFVQAGVDLTVEIVPPAGEVVS